MATSTRENLFLSIVIPVFNEEEVIDPLVGRLQAVADGLECSVEILFVNDGSRDATLERLIKHAAEDHRIKIVDLSRNFGHQMAITAGVDFARGDVVVVMDGDLQDPPEIIPQMLKLSGEGFDVVYAKRRHRQGESRFKRLSASLFYRLMRRMTSVDLPEDTGDFRLMSRPVVDAFGGMREQHRFVRGMIRWVGFRQTEILFDREPRLKGKTKFSLPKMFHFAMDAIFSFSPTPLRLITLLGLFVLAGGVIYLIYNLYAHFYLHVTVPGWTSIVFLQVSLSGALLVAVGVIGEYIARIFEEIKRRPLYIVRQVINMEAHRQAPGGMIPLSER